MIKNTWHLPSTYVNLPWQHPVWLAHNINVLHHTHIMPIKHICRMIHLCDIKKTQLIDILMVVSKDSVIKCGLYNLRVQELMQKKTVIMHLSRLVQINMEYFAVPNYSVYRLIQFKILCSCFISVLQDRLSESAEEPSTKDTTVPSNAT